MRIIKKALQWLVPLLLIFSLGVGAGYGLALYQDTTEIPESSEIVAKNLPNETEATTEFEPNLIDQLTPPPDSVDYQLIEHTIIELVNDLREELGVGTLQPNADLRTAANIRAVEIESSFSHTRPNGTEPFTALEEEGINYSYYMAGENLAMATYYRSDEYMAHLLFNGWVESKDHYETMINPDFKEIGVGVHYNGDILYATQFFGLRR